MSSLPRVDRRTAVATGRRLLPPGPPASPVEVEHVVRRLRSHAARAAGHVREVSGLDAPSGVDALVVDRDRWLEANVHSFAGVWDAVAEDRRDGRGAVGGLPGGSPGGGPAGRAGGAVGAAVGGAIGGLGAVGAGVQLGGLLAYLAPRVLGQFDPFADHGGRLLLVAPNVLQVERALEVPVEDFRLWVCLHEETHRVQFGHARWLPDHLRSLLGAVLADVDRSQEQLVPRLLRRVRERSARPGAGGRPPAASSSLVDVLTTPEQRQRVEQITAVMSLLEGHADVMMDRVGPQVIPSVRTIRERFGRRRGRRGLDRVLRRLLGLEAKLAQYRDGARFVRQVLRARGLEGFNVVFDSPDSLPGPEEIQQPRRWLERVG